MAAHLIPPTLNPLQRRFSHRFGLGLHTGVFALSDVSAVTDIAQVRLLYAFMPV